MASLVSTQFDGSFIKEVEKNTNGVFENTKNSIRENSWLDISDTFLSSEDIISPECDVLGDVNIEEFLSF